MTMLSDEEPDIKMEMELDSTTSEGPAGVPFSATVFAHNPFKDPSFRQAKDKSLAICELLSEALSQMPYLKKRTDLINLLEEILENPAPNSEKVALVGRTGAGKSSLICSLGGDQFLAKTEASGEAVTNIIQEFHQRPETSLVPYMIVCTFQTEEQIKERLENLLDDFRRFELDEAEPSDPEYRAAEENHLLAIDVFEAAFSAIADFDIELLNYGNTEITRESAIEKLNSWAKQIPRPEEEEDGRWSGVFSTGEEFQMMISTFQNHSLWPFIDRMDIFVDSEVLKDGLVVTDLPGLCDTNAARVESARRYLPVANEIWAITDIARALNDRTIKDIFEMFFPTKKLTSVSSGQGPGNVNVGKVRKPRMTIVCTCSARYAKATPWEDMRGAVDKKEVQRLRQRIAASSEAEKEIAERELEILQLEGRARSVTEKLLEAYKGRVEQDELRVFCVDSHLYWAGGSELERSGIPDLQKYASSIMAKTLFNFHNSRIEYRLPAIFNTIEAWFLSLISQSEGGSNHFSTDLQDINSAKKDVDHWSKDVLAPKTKVTQVISKRTKVILHGTETWVAALRMLRGSTIAAFCRKQGVHKPKGKRIQVRWGEEINECFNKVTAVEWRRMDVDVEQAWNNLQKSTKDRFDGYYEHYSQADAPELILTLLRTTKENLQQQIREARRAFVEEVQTIKSKATFGGFDSYVLAYLVPVLRDCAARLGRGARSARIGLLSDALLSGELVTSYIAKLKSEYEGLVRSTKAVLTSHINEAVDAINPDSQKMKDPTTTTTTIPYFQRWPDRQLSIENKLRRAKADMEEMARLAAPAQARAVELWGQETDVETNI